MPIPNSFGSILRTLVQQAITLAKENSAESERTYDFVAPLREPADHDARMAELARVEAAIDAEVTRLYGLTEDDFEVINRELAITTAAAEGGDDNSSDEGDEDGEGEDNGYSPELWARSWISYAVGIVMGRFRPGETGALGRGDFADEVNVQLQTLRVADGIAVADAGHPDDLAGRCWQALERMRGEAGAREIVATACGGGDSEEQLRAWLDGDFWSYHMQLYRNRPVYWPLETDTRKAVGRYRVWVFHETLTPDTLFRVRERFAEPKLRHTEGRIKELELKILSADSRAAARDFQKKKEEAECLLDALRKFSTALADIANGTGETLTGWEQPKGYAPCIDDGVVINAAPLWPLIPKWKQSNKPILKEAWHKLATTPDLDWAGQAMRYWPTRVLETCQTNKSIAIAHGVQSNQ